MSTALQAPDAEEVIASSSTAVPPHVASLIGTPPLRGHAVLLCVASDVDEAGNAAEQWMIATERELAVVAEPDALRGASARCVRVFPLAEIDGCRAQGEVGSGYLQVKQGDVWIDVLRFSNRLAPKFRDIAHRVETLRSNHEFFMADPGESEHRCSKCGGPLRSRNAICPKCAPSARTFRRVMLLLKPYWARMALILGLCGIAVAVELAPPWLQKILVDDVLTGKHPAGSTSRLLITLAGIVVSLAVVRLVAALISVWKARLSSDIGTRLTADLRTQMVEKLQRLSVSYHDRNQVGMLMSRVSYDTEAMHTFLHQVSGGFVLQLLQLVAIGVMLFVINAKLAAFTLLPMPLVMLASWYFGRCLYARHHRYWDAVGRQASALTSLLSGIRVVKSFTQEPREQARFQGASERLRESRVGVDLTTATFSSLIGFLFGLGGLVVWYVGGRDVLADQMSLGSLMAFLAYLSMFYAPLTTVSEGMTWISSFLSASHRIFDLLDTPVSVDEPPTPPPVTELKGHIQFDHVTFSYDDKKPALDDVTFDVKPGEFLGIVGRSGSGKSTLVCLVSRLYDVDSGSVTIDGIDVRKLSSSYLRRRVGMVLQEPFLFEGTVAANIAYGDPDAAPDRIITSAKAASAHDFILRMPFGYESPLGERGAGLSGGERQRVSIARAILYDPKILVLDEATSSIDTESERLIQRAVERLASGRTTLAIAHRLTTLENADRLLVMDQGHIIEQGTHRELLAADGMYSQLVRRQFASLGSEAVEVLLAPQTATACADPEETAERDEYLADLDSGWEVRWLEPRGTQFFLGPHGVLSVRIDGKDSHGISTVRAFPASYSEQFLSIRVVDEEGRDGELGMIRELAEWPKETQELIRRSLNRRYLLRVIHGIVSLREDHGFITCSAETDHGELEFVVHNNPHAVKRFGYNGRLMTDLDDNHYLIPDVDQLPFLQRRLFKLHFPEW